MPLEYQRDGDIGFIGLNSRDNPASLPQGLASKSQNFRLDRGVATVRKGIQRKTSSPILNKTIYGTGSYLDATSQEIFVIVLTDGVYTYNPQTEIFSTKISFPIGETITTRDGCDVVTAIDKVYITRGHSKRPLICTIDLTSYAITGIIAAPTAGTGAEFPNCSGLLYYANRLIAIGQDHRLGYTPTARSRDSIGVSNYLDFDHWDALDVFNFNEGSNDEIVAIAPWTLNEFVVFLKNSIFYVNVGSGRYVYSDALSSSASMKNLVSDVGCLAKRSVIQADGGIIFLSDSGVYFMSPSQVGTNESMRLLTVASPLSAPIDDVIQRINKKYAYRSVGVYWNNRYYLAVPLDDSTDNNTILVYNFILKQWESVDTYPNVSLTSVYEVSNYASPSNTTIIAYNTSQNVEISKLSVNQNINLKNFSRVGEVSDGNYAVVSKSTTQSYYRFVVQMQQTVSTVSASYTITYDSLSRAVANVTTTSPHNLTAYPFSSSIWAKIFSPDSKFANSSGVTYNVFIVDAYNFFFFPTSLINGTTSGTLNFHPSYATVNWSYGFDVFNFLIAKKDNQRRMFSFDTDEGIFLMEQLEYDEYGSSLGTPNLPFYLPTTLNPSAYTPVQINAELNTRLYTFNQLKDKRFSTVEADMLFNAGSAVTITAETINPDTTTKLETYSSGIEEDFTRRLAIRKIGYGLKVKFITNNNRSSIRSVNVISTILGKQNISKK